jgi:hypothetical protein
VPHRAFGARFLLAGVPKLVQDLLGFVGPFASQYIIEWLEIDGAPFYVGAVWAVALFLGPFLQSVFVNQYFAMTFNTGMQVRRSASELGRERHRESTHVYMCPYACLHVEAKAFA